jgi:hypothetical protein
MAGQPRLEMIGDQNNSDGNVKDDRNQDIELPESGCGCMPDREVVECCYFEIVSRINQFLEIAELARTAYIPRTN